MAQRGSKQPKQSRGPKSKGARTRQASEPAKSGASEDDAARAALLASEKLYYRIGEVSELTGVKAHVLRYWETEFRWMAPPKSRSKQRLYRKRDIEFVWLLKRLLWDERYTIAGARQRIQDLGVDEALALLDLPAGEGALVPTASTSNSAGPGSAEWASIGVALGEMQSELLSLRGVLQEGL